MISIDQYEGDPKIYIGLDGAEIRFQGGQSIMDAGVENELIIMLLTNPGWYGNYFLSSEKQISSDFENKMRAPVTKTGLQEIRLAALAALESLKDVEVDVYVPRSGLIQVDIVSSRGNLSITKEDSRWIIQAIDPANEKRVN